MVAHSTTPTIGEEADTLDAVARTMRDIRDRFAAADTAAKRADTLDDREAAIRERDAARDEHYLAAYTLGRLGLTLLRYAVEYHPTETMLELRPLVEQILAADLPGAIAAIRGANEHR